MTDAERDACYRRIEQALRNAIGTESQPWYDLIAMIEDENKRRKQMADLTGLTPQQLMDWREDDSPFNWYDIVAEIERRLLRAQQMERIQRIIDVYFAPWGAAKAAMWEELSGDGPFSPETALNLIRAALGERPPTPTMSREEAERIAAQWVYHGGSPYESDNILLESLAGLLQSVARGERP